MIMKKFKLLTALLLTTALVFSLSPVNAFATVDIMGAEDYWVAPVAGEDYMYGALDGLQDEVWQTDAYVTRADFASMINSAFGYDTLSVPELAGYEDVPEDEWYANDMSLSIALRYIIGYGYHVAAPEDHLTREQAAVMLCKILRLPLEGTGSGTNFTDMAEVSGWARGAVQMMGEHGYIAGDNGRFRPKSNLTNDEAVQLITNVYGTIIDESLDAQGTIYPQNVTIRQSGVTLKNAVIKGDLFITEGIGDGDVWLESVQVEGRLLVAGGGENSIHVKDITLDDNVLVDKPFVSGNEPVRFVIESNDIVIVQQGVIKDMIIAADITIICDDVGGEMQILSLLASDGELAEPNILIVGGAIIEKITVFVPAQIQGNGMVGTLEAHTTEVILDSAIQIDQSNLEEPEEEEIVEDEGADETTEEDLVDSTEAAILDTFSGSL